MFFLAPMFAGGAAAGAGGATSAVAAKTTAAKLAAAAAKKAAIKAAISQGLSAMASSQEQAPEAEGPKLPWQPMAPLYDNQQSQVLRQDQEDENSPMNNLFTKYRK